MTVATSAGIRALLENASVEMTCNDAGDLAEAAALLRSGTDIFIALFPDQTWDELINAAAAVRSAGFNPVPHVPARRVKDRTELAAIARRLANGAGVTSMLLIAGDMPAPVGAFDSTIGILETGELAAAGIHSICVAGHPEGHPHMTTDQQRQYEARKVELSQEQGFDLSFTTQVCFESAPLIHWERQLRATGIAAGVRAGLAGPADIQTLLRFATICGARASMRALTSGKAGLVGALLRDRGPEEVVAQMAASQLAGISRFAGVHMFSFGGFLKTATWLSAVQAGRFALHDDGSDFTVQL